MKTFKLFFYPIMLAAFFMFATSVQSCKPDDEKEDDECKNCPVVYKPNIYIYPELETELEVKLNFPKSGNVVASIPEYGSGWQVNVKPDGLIDNQHNYLFYESQQPDVWQRTEGWCVKQSDLKDFFERNLANWGFAGREISDFTDYWIPRLGESAYYVIYPQHSDIIKEVIVLQLSQEPDNILRLFYVIEEAKTPLTNLKEPMISCEFNRNGFLVTEWGVILE